MPIPPLTYSQRLANYYLYKDLYDSLATQPITLPTVKTWKLVFTDEPAPACTYTEIADNPMDLSAANIAEAYPNYGGFKIKAIAAYCRYKYESAEFPQNAKLNNI